MLFKKIISTVSAVVIAIGCAAGSQFYGKGEKGTITASAATTKAASVTTTYILPTQRISGSNRYQTAVECSKATFPKGARFVIIASGENYADALAGTTLAGTLCSPLLLSESDVLPSETLAEIKRIKPERIYILGGESSVSEDVKKTIEDAGFKAYRLAGKTRYETSVAIAKNNAAQIGAETTEVFFVSGNGFADALSIAPVAAAKRAPVIYINKSGALDPSVEEYLSERKGIITTAHIIGGEGAVGKAADAQIKKYIPNVSRISGSNRYYTNLNIIKLYANYFTSKNIILSTAMDYPDALAGSIYAKYNSTPIMLVGDTVTAYQLAYIKARNTQTAIILGGESSVSEGTIMSMFSFVEPEFTLLNFGTYMSLTWQESPKASAYELYRDGKLIKSFTDLTITSYTDTGLNASKDYNYTLKFVYNNSGKKIYRSFSMSSSDYRAILNSVSNSPKYTMRTENAQGAVSTNSYYDVRYSLSGKDWATLDKFAKEHFTSDMTNADKVAYTLNWINKNVWYGTVQDGGWAKLLAMCNNGTFSYVNCIFNHKIGQCNCYNGALVSMMLYLGYDAHLVMGYRGNAYSNGSIKSKWQHFWGEVVINGQTYVMEAGNYGEDGDWKYICERYRAVDTPTHGYIKNGKIMMT